MTIIKNPPKSKLKLIDLTSDNEVPSSGNDNQTLQPNPGYIYKIKHIIFEVAGVNGGSVSSGTHILSGYLDNVNSKFLMFKVASNYYSYIKINGANGFVGNDTESPSDISQQHKLLFDSLIISNDVPFVFNYNNDTDDSTTRERFLNILVEEIPER